MDKVILWGLSNYGKNILKCRMIPIDAIEGIVDTDKRRQGTWFLGKETKSPEQIKAFESKVIVIASQRFYHDIASQIEQMDDTYEILEITQYAKKFPCLELHSTAAQMLVEERVPLPKPIDECNKIWDKFKNVMTVRNIADPHLKKKVRIGRNNDGGYVMIEDAMKQGKVAYSIGICDDVSWDLQMAEQYGYDIFQYDHTILQKPLGHEKFHYKKIGICGSKSDAPNLMTLKQMLEENHHTNETGMVLKMDVEGAEWDVIDTVTQEMMEQFDQIVLEIHGFDRIDQMEARLQLLEKINRTHQLVHIHGNNNRYLDRRTAGAAILIYAYEVTYVKKDKYEFYDDDNWFPQEIDQPCDPAALDIELGNWGKKDS